MREVTNKTWYLEFDKKLNGHIGLKYIKQMSKPVIVFSNGKQYTGLDKGYTILEYVPQNTGYNARVFFDTQNQPICFYFDINNGTGVQNNMPWYDDLYLDVIMECPVITKGDYHIYIDDQNQLEQAKKDGLVSEQLFAKAHQIAAQLVNELKTNSNQIVARCVDDVLRIKKQLNIK